MDPIQTTPATTPAAADATVKPGYKTTEFWMTAGATAVGLPILAQALFIRDELLPGNVSGMRVQLEEAPLVSRQFAHVDFAIDVLPRARATENERSGVARIVQALHCHGMRQVLPSHVAGSSLPAHRELEALVTKQTHDTPCRADAGEGRKERPQGLLHVLVGVELDATAGVVNQPDGQRHLQFSTTGLVEHATDQAGFEHMQLRFTHRAFQPE